MPLKCTRLIKQKTGLSLKDFCEQHLASEYKTFQARFRKRKMFPAEVAYICWLLGVSCEEAFGGAPYSELVMFQGKGNIPEKAKALWEQADGIERTRLLSLLGLDLEFLIPKLPKPEPRPLKASKVKRQAKRLTQTVQEPLIDPLNFFEDISKPDEEVGIGAPEEATPVQNDNGIDFFIDV